MTIIANDFRASKKNVFVTDLERGNKVYHGLIILDDVGKEHGNRDRWAKVWKVGSEVDDLAPNDWVLVKAGRWTTGIDMVLNGVATKVWRIDYPEAAIMVTDTDPRSPSDI